MAIAYKHVQEAVVPPAPGQRRTCPSRSRPSSLRCLAKQPADRYPSAEDLRSDLRNYLEGQPVRAMGAAGAAAAGAAAGAVIGATVGDATMAVPTTPGGPGTPPGGTPPYVPADEPQKRTGLYVALLLGGLVLVALVLFFVGTQLNQPTKQVAVPDVVGIEVTDAQSRVEAAGFEVEIRTDISDRPVGTVFEQTPAGNTNADEGSTVLLRVSGGLGSAPVPGVIGRTQAAAESLLTNAGFVPNATDAGRSRRPGRSGDQPEPGSRRRGREGLGGRDRRSRRAPPRSPSPISSVRARPRRRTRSASSASR